MQQSGAGENRTLVQTGKSYAFYTLIPALIFEHGQDLDHQPVPYPLKKVIVAARPAATIPNFAAPLSQSALGH